MTLVRAAAQFSDNLRYIVVKLARNTKSSIWHLLIHVNQKEASLIFYHKVETLRPNWHYRPHRGRSFLLPRKQWFAAHTSISSKSKWYEIHGYDGVVSDLNLNISAISQFHKSDNLHYDKYASSLGCWDKWLVNQASDVPSITFFS